MKVDVEDITTVKKILHVEIPESKVTLELDKAYRTLKRMSRSKDFVLGRCHVQYWNGVSKKICMQKSLVS